MVTLSLSNEQVVDWVKQLPQEGKQAVLDALASEQDIWWDLTFVAFELGLACSPSRQLFCKGCPD